MDIASVIGLVLCFALMIFGMLVGQDISVIMGFLHAPSALITYGGALGCMMASCTMPDFIANLKSIGLIFKMSSMNVPEIIQKIIDLSNVARKEGLLSLEEAAGEIEDEFLKKGIMLVVDGTDPELVRAIMETELASVEERHKDKIGFWDGLGAMGPAWGMIGTLIGLVDMLYHMDNVATLGPAMAVALITTFYGSVLANAICTPVSNKLKVDNAAEMMLKEVMIEGLLSIQAGENPRVIEEKLKSFLSPNEREAASSGEAGGEE